jgi:ATP-dependent Clp protease ATP-binding subunit ClpA
MFERYTEKARRVVLFSRYDARQLCSPLIDTECLLLGIVRESADLITSIAGPDAIETITNRIRQQYPVRDKIGESVDLPFSEEAKHALISALDEANRLNRRVITSKHILSGLSVTPEAVRKYREREENTADAILDDRVAGKPVLNQAFQKAVTDAVKEASLLRSKSVKPEHLLLALLRDESSLAAKILREAGLSHEAVRRKLKGD